MCDRTKVEVLARELAFEYYSGFRKAKGRMLIRYEAIQDAVDVNWPIWEAEAKRIIESLGEHK